jgi:glycosyltransferase involved in cell wall biosynthesis
MDSVCFVSPEYFPLSGGTGTYVHYLSNELLRHGYSVYIITGSTKNMDVEIGRNRQVFFLKTLRAPILKSFDFAWNAREKMKNLKHRLSVDITHANLPLVPSFAIPLDFGAALVSTVHSTWKGEAEAIRCEPYTRLNSNEKFMVSFNWVLRFFERKLLEQSDMIIAVSEYTKTELKKYYGLTERRIRVIHNGVSVERFRPALDKAQAKVELGLRAEDKVVLYVGRLYSRKGLFTLIQSIPFVVKKFKDVKYVISGKGLKGEVQKLAEHAAKLKVERNILFTGYFPDAKLPRLYQAADIFAFSTMYENFPFAVLEALSSGLPVVTTDVGGIPELVVDGQNGFLVKPFDAQGLAERILFLLESPRLCAEFGRNGRNTVIEKFAWQDVAHKVMSVYAEVLT